jgi:AcrR family transcriptional regulator
MASPVTPSSERILMSALELFASKGYEGTSVREICEAAGITKPTLYHHYGSKEGVYRALVDGTLGDFRNEITQALAGPGTAPERLKRVARAYFEGARSHREVVRFIFALVHGQPGSAPATDFSTFYEGIVGLLAQEVDAGVTRGELATGPTDVRMLLLMGALGEALCGYLIVGRPDLTSELADRLVDTLLEGWLP